MAGAAMAGAAGAAMFQSAGGLAALNAAFKGASQAIGSSDIGSVSATNSGSKNGGLAEAMGTAAKFAGSFGQHLASGAMDVAREKAGSMKEAFAEKIADTTGGKIADAIQNKADLSASETKDSESQNVLSMGAPEGSFSRGDDTSDEVSQFVNQKASGDSQ